MDECHETKSPGTGAMRLVKDSVMNNIECKTLFMFGTTWSQPPAEPEGNF